MPSSAFSTTIYLRVRETDQAVANTTILQNDNTLFDPIYIGRRYAYRLFIPFNLSGLLGGGGFKFGFSFPAGSSGRWTAQVNNLVTGVFSTATMNALTGNVTGALGSTGDHVCLIEGFCLCGADGLMRFQFAQNASNASPITILTGARMEYFETAEL